MIVDVVKCVLILKLSFYSVLLRYNKTLRKGCKLLRKFSKETWPEYFEWRKLMPVAKTMLSITEHKEVFQLLAHSDQFLWALKSTTGCLVFSRKQNNKKQRLSVMINYFL